MAEKTTEPTEATGQVEGGEVVEALPWPDQQVADATKSFADFEAQVTKEIEDSEKQGGSEEDDTADKGTPPSSDGDKSGEDGAKPVADGGAAGTTPAAKPAGKNKVSFKERIGQLTAAKSAAELRAEAAEAALAAERAAKSEKKTAPEEKNTLDNGAPDPEKYAYGVLDPEYIDALTDFKAAKAVEKVVTEAEKSRQAKAAQDDAAELEAKWETQLEVGHEKYDDFVEKVVLGSAGEKPAWPLSEHLGVLIQGSDVGADIAYHLASNPAEAREVYQKSPLQQAAYFGKLEARFSQPPADTPKGKQAKIPQAEPPIAAPRGANGKFQARSDTTDFKAFEASHKHLLADDD